MKQTATVVIGMMLFNVGCTTTSASSSFGLEQFNGTYHIEAPAFNGSEEMYVAIQGNTITWRELDTGVTAIETYTATPLDTGNGYAYQRGDQLPLWIFRCNGHLMMDNGIDDIPKRLIPSAIPAGGRLIP